MEIDKHLDKMLKMFGEIPDPIHQPKKFRYLVSLYLYLQGERPNE